MKKTIDIGIDGIDWATDAFGGGVAGGAISDCGAGRRGAILDELVGADRAAPAEVVSVGKAELVDEIWRGGCGKRGLRRCGNLHGRAGMLMVGSTGRRTSWCSRRGVGGA